MSWPGKSRDCIQGAGPELAGVVHLRGARHDVDAVDGAVGALGRQEALGRAVRVGLQVPVAVAEGAEIGVHAEGSAQRVFVLVVEVGFVAQGALVVIIVFGFQQLRDRGTQGGARKGVAAAEDAPRRGQCACLSGG